MIRRYIALATATVTATAALLGASPVATAAPASGPWGPPHVLYDGRSAETIAQATTTDGTTVVVFQKNPRGGERSWLVAIRRSGEPWSEPVPLSDRRAFRPTVVAWGAGHLSVIWQSPAGQDNYRFHLRSLDTDGTLTEPERLIKATYAYPVYQAAMNSGGQVALAWSNGDLYDRVVLRQPDGSWTRYPRVPVLHPTCCGGLQYISNPRALFLDDAGRVSNITWGTVDDSAEAIWLTRPDADDGWRTQRIGPVDGGATEYGRVPDASYASNPRGDLVVTWPQSKLGDWSVHLRFAENGHPLGEPTTLSNQCPPDGASPCVGVAIAEDGTSTVAYGRGVRGDMAIEMVRRDPDGTFTPAQTLAAGFLWALDLQVAGNPAGDTIVSFRSYPPSRSAFARCPATQPCAETLLLSDGDPSTLDVWTTSMDADAEVTVTWSEYYHEGISTRQLAAAG